METFAWEPDFEASNAPTTTVVECKFGDGYSQRQAVGINSSSDVLSLSFNKRSLDEGNAIKAFLKSRNGVESFLFSPPGESEMKKFVCRTGKWSYKVTQGMFISISAVFEQVYEP